MKPNPPLETLILTVRQQKVILDADLAELYGVTTGALNQAVKRNADRFPTDFVFQLSRDDIAGLKSQFVISNAQHTAYQHAKTAPPRGAAAGHGGRRTPPYAFTEHGALMAANVLNSPAAVKMSVYVVRAFIKLREMLLAQSDVLKRLAQMDSTLLEHDDALRVIWRELQPLLNPPPAPPKPQIGFHQK